MPGRGVGGREPPRHGCSGGADTGCTAGRPDGSPAAPADFGAGTGGYQRPGADGGTEPDVGTDGCCSAPGYLGSGPGNQCAGVADEPSCSDGYPGASERSRAYGHTGASDEPSGTD